MLIRDVRDIEPASDNPEPARNGAEPMASPVTIRRERREGDADAIVDLHVRLYTTEFERNHNFVAGVRDSVDAAIAKGWPETGGGIWMAERDGRVVGSAAVTDEGDGSAKLRWVALESELRGLGIGRRMVTEAVELAREGGYDRIWLETFHRLTAAASIYRSLGFVVTSETPKTDWGPAVTFQAYELRF
jgi:ribosomal protein S18 acetylase RimI-like enzyme